MGRRKRMQTTGRTYGGWSVAAGLVAAAAAGLMAGAALAQGGKSVTLAEGQMQVVAVPFEIKTYKVADQEVARVEMFDKQNVRIVGQKVGTTDLQVLGEGNAFANFKVTVVENIDAILQALRKDLDEVPEVDLSVSLGRIVIKGEVNSVQHWELVQKVVSLYGENVADLTTFRPAPEVLLSLRKGLEKGGFTVADRKDAVARNPGVLSVDVSGNNLFITGSVFSRNDLAAIEDIVGAERWLAVKKENEEAKEDRIPAILKVNVIPSLLELDVAFANVTDQEEKQVGINLVKNGLLVVDTTAAAFRGTIGKDATSGFEGSYVINSALAGTMKLFGGSGPGRRSVTGHMTFKNDAPDWQKYQSGGTLKVRVSGRDVADLEDIEYGFIMKVKGGLLNADTAAMDLDLELSFPVPMGADYDLKREHIETTVNCPLGKTLVMGGVKDLSEKVTKEGVPFLRSIPVLSFLFSEKNQIVEDRKVLILICPSMNTTTLAGTRYSEQTTNTLREANMPVEDLKKEKRAQEKKTKGIGRFF
jgi:Flp pilus assembly secretin CpaC